MRIRTVGIGLLLAAAFCARAGEIRWEPTLEKAMESGKKAGRPVAVCFFDDEGFSARLEAELSQEKVSALFASMSAVRLTLEGAPEAAARFKVQATPSIVLLNAEGKLLGILNGYQPAAALVLSIEEVLKRTPRDLDVAMRTKPATVPGPGVAPPAADAPGEDVNPMVPVAERMDVVGQDIRREDTGPIVQKQIKSILDELDRLIEEASQQSSSSQQKQQKKQKQEQGEGEPKPGAPKPGQGKQGGMDPSSPMTDSQTVERDGGMGLNQPFASPHAAWGNRVPVESEKSAVLKAREGKVPPEYEGFINEYMKRLLEAREGGR